MAVDGNTTSASEWRQHWPILLPGMAGVMLCAVHGYSLGVMIAPLEREFGWLRAEISAGPLITAIVALFCAPLVGNAIDRLGPRRIGLFGILFYCTALSLLSLATPGILSWWGLWVVLAVANMFVIPTVWTAAINGYFDKNRGLALAIALCGTGLTAAIVPALTNSLVGSFGWRGAYIALGVIGAAVVFPPAWFLLHTADSRRVAPATSAAAASPAAPIRGSSSREALTSPAFLKVAGAAGIFSVAICCLTTNAVPVLMGNGLTPANAAAVAGLIGMGSITGRLGGGYLLDRLDAGKVAAASVVLPVVTILMLLALPGSTTGAAIACVVLGLAVGTELDACAYLATRHFGLRNFGTLFGTINGLLLFGAGVSPLAANYVYDVTGSYDPVLWAIIPACLASSALFLLLGPYPEFDDQADQLLATESPAPATQSS